MECKQLFECTNGAHNFGRKNAPFLCECLSPKNYESLKRCFDNTNSAFARYALDYTEQLVFLPGERSCEVIVETVFNFSHEIGEFVYVRESKASFWKP